MREIRITDIENIRIGQFENSAAATGCTVFVAPKGMTAGVDVRGGGPASRETQLLNPSASAAFIHAIVLAGGSAYGLGTADGVMKCLEERGIGIQVGPCIVPLVCQSDLFDLTIGDGSVRPDASYGYEAARIALDGGNYRDGNYGAGCGATVGKWTGMEHCMKSGIGSYAVQIGELQIGAVVVVNAIGDIYDYKKGKKVAGYLRKDGDLSVDTVDLMLENAEPVREHFTGNTTLGVLITNAAFDKAKLGKIAAMTQNGYARSIRPVHTSADGDSIYAVSVGEVQADADVVGTVAADVMSEAILRAVYHCESAYGYLSASDLPQAEM